jgi:hypothetical protein
MLKLLLQKIGLITIGDYQEAVMVFMNNEAALKQEVLKLTYFRTHVMRLARFRQGEQRDRAYRMFSAQKITLDSYNMMCASADEEYARWVLPAGQPLPESPDPDRESGQ